MEHIGVETAVGTSVMTTIFPISGKTVLQLSLGSAGVAVDPSGRALYTSVLLGPSTMCRGPALPTESTVFGNVEENLVALSLVVSLLHTVCSFIWTRLDVILGVQCQPPALSWWEVMPQPTLHRSHGGW